MIMPEGKPAQDAEIFEGIADPEAQDHERDDAGDPVAQRTVDDGDGERREDDEAELHAHRKRGREEAREQRRGGVDRDENPDHDLARSCLPGSPVISPPVAGRPNER
jgi:hypothetical protein